jgi:hypothetical protein
VLSVAPELVSVLHAATLSTNIASTAAMFSRPLRLGCRMLDRFTLRC